MQAGDGQGVLVTSEGDGGALFYCPGGVLTARPSLAFDKTTVDADASTSRRSPSTAASP